MAAAAATAVAAPATGDWRLATRIAFRFVFSYLAFFIFPFPIGAVPGTVWLGEQYTKLWNEIIPWLATHVLRLAGPLDMTDNGSGDRTGDYILLLANVAVAVVATIVWSALDSRRRHYRTLLSWLRVAVRYTLAAAMFSYGFIKVVKGQFPAPGLGRLVEPYGESSPMGLLWTFMGYSTPYTVFGGLAESLGGLLLLFRRTTTLGALVVAAVMTNVVMMNFSYDVCVKLYSTHLALLAIFLLAGDARRLVRFLVLNRPTEAAPLGPTLSSRWRRRTGLAAKVLLVGLLLYANGKSAWTEHTEYGNVPPGPRDGIYDVTAYAANGTIHPPLLTDGKRWRRVVIEWGWLHVQRMDDSKQYYGLALDEADGLAILSDSSKEAFSVPQRVVVKLTRANAEELELEGKIGDENLSIRLKKADPSKLLLVSRGFHWINERPFNR